MNASHKKGAIRVIGLGPGDHRFMTHDADVALQDASDLIGYIPYVERIPPREGLTSGASCA
jgi:precorrin-3B C17-methyltransferase